MRLDLAYVGASEVRPVAGGQALAFAPNLRRDKVFFDGQLRHPVRFREAISALHAVVVSDLRAVPRDRSAWEAWKKQQAADEAALRQRMLVAAQARARAELGADVPDIPDLEKAFRREHALYWRVRRQWASELARDDAQLFRHLVPCDPVVTVADDVVFFECFSKDESSYGMLTVDRDAFTGHDVGRGTTNVDYSLALFDHFQTLRTYRPTRLQVDPSGFEVKVEGRGDYREEKIDLPPSWLRGFGQILAASCLPTRVVPLGVEVVHGLLAFLRRHRERQGPRSLRFELTPGQPPAIVIEPWDVRLVSHSTTYAGPKPETIKVWGRRRLQVLGRLLPLAEGFDVHLLGSGLPSTWVARLGEMSFQLALSGWTANDWTGGARLDLLAGDGQVAAGTVRRLDAALKARPSATRAEVEAALGGAPVAGAVHQLAREGQLIYDHAAARFRHRSILPVALSADVLGPESGEAVAGRALVGQVDVAQDTPMGANRLLVARVGGTRCEGLLDPDGVLTRARCTCSFFHTHRLRSGPCRHLLALRLRAGG
ncbi:MAG: SWIM zinc finger family protein [Myxococcales bacterium]|nr:SWIM zinc finger family protein [Myxococcales bacterium]